ncbi:MAG: DUF5011 domain-containing protein, partial [Gammaproteobacteria bacterium]|nr:DUF5011 domain-containing protein [Gammaproteobacteria bacterium]
AGNAAPQVTRTVNVTPDVALAASSLTGSSPVNIELGTPYTDAGASASDNIDGDITTSIATANNVNVNAVGSYSVTYNVSDAAGNAAPQVTRSVNVTPDVTLPVISLAGASTVNIELGTPYSDAGASASDNIDGDITASIAIVSSVNVNAVGSYSVTYNVSDAAGNAAAQVTRSVNVTPDITRPIISLTGASPVNIELGTPYTDAGASATDNIDGNLTTNIATVSNVNVNVVGSYSVTYNVSDAAGNAALQVTRTVNVTPDVTLPVISLTGVSPVDIELGTPYADAGASASDNIDGDITASIATASSVNVNAVGSYSVTYNVSDAAGNAAAQVTRSVNVTPDITRPVISLTGASPVNIELGTPYSDAGASATDNIDGNLTTNIATASNVNVNAVGSYSVTFNVTDAAGNAALQVTRTVNVTPDVTLPVISLAGASPVDIELGTPYVDAGASAIDNIDGDLAANIATVSNVNVNAVDSYSVTYNVSDAAGNAALQVTRIVNVTHDATLPVISLVGISPVNIELGTPYSDAGASASDNIDGVLTSSIATNSNVNVNAVGSYSVTYNVSDATGNAASQVTRTVNVTPDVTLPVISLAGVSPIDIELGTPYTDAGASASDNIDGVLTASITTVSNVNVNTVGSYSVTYNVSDAAGNAALQVTRSVNVTPDVTLPVISLAGASPIDIELGTPYTDAGASASDNIDGILTASIATVSNVNVNTVGGYNVTYNVSDAAGNAALQVTRSVNVTPDVTLPVISLAGASPVDIELGTPYVDAGASASDNIDGVLTANIATVSNVNVNAVGSYSVTYNVSDAAGNIALQVTRSVNVTPDVTRPVISLAGASPVDIELGTPYSDAGASASDNIDGDLSVNIATVSNVNVNAVGSYSVTYNVSDAAGNAAPQVTRSVKVTPDVTAPAVTAPASVIVAATAANGAAASNASIATFLSGATADDSVDGSVAITTDAPSLFPLGATTVTFSASDSAGNTDTAQATVTILDQGLPTITLLGSSTVDIELGTPYNDAGSNVTDNVDTGLVATVSGGVNTDVVGLYLLTYNVSDAAGNAAIAVVRSVNVTADVTTPTVNAPTNLTVAATNAAGTAATQVAIAGFLTAAMASDTVDGTLLTTHNAPAQFPLGVTTITFSASDNAGNTGTAQATVTVADQSRPVITLLGTSVNIELGRSYSDAGSSVSDNVDSGLVASISGSVNTSLVDLYLLTYNVSDTAGNAAIPVVRSVNVTADVTAPTITVPTNLTVAAVDASGTAGSQAAIANFLTAATAIDIVDGTLIATHNAPAQFPLGVTPVTFGATDSTGNTGTAQATVTVTDQQQPVITLLGSYSVTIELGTPYSDAGSSISDNVDAGLVATVSGNVNTDVVGLYLLTYNVSDAAGNAATTVVRGILVQDSSVPDTDQDGIPDFIDGISDPTLLQSRAGVTDSWLLSTQAGLSLHLGSISRALGTYGAAVSAQDIEIYESQVGGIVLQVIDSYRDIGGYFDFEIHGLAQPGDSALIVIPQYTQIPQDAVFRRYEIGAGWFDFVEDANNQLFSAAGAPGTCPLPGDPAYIPGLNAGHRCVQLLIEDGGSNDADGVGNGVILDPGGVAVIDEPPAPTPTKPPSESGGSGGGSMNLPILLLLLLARLLLMRDRMKLGTKQ